MNSNGQEDAKRPSAQEAMRRAIILTHIFVKAAATPPPGYLRKWMESWSEADRKKCLDDFTERFALQEKRMWDAGLWEYMDEAERVFMQTGPLETTDRHQIDASWSVEAITCLLWALGLRDDIPSYDKQVPHEAIRFEPGVRAHTLVEQATLRPASEIDRQRVLAESWHWRCRTHELLKSGKIPPVLDNGAPMDNVILMSASFTAENGGFDAPLGDDYPACGKPLRDLTEEEFSSVMSISTERHKALNWLCGYAPGNQWDETPTDT